MTEVYPSGPDLSGTFPKPLQPQVQLPPRFDDRCKICKAQMEQMPSIYCTEVKPFATFQCPAPCKTRLMLFEVPGAPNDPLFIWTGDPGITNRKELEARLNERREKEERDLIRHGQAAV